jgi:hypothetical protein
LAEQQASFCCGKSKAQQKVAVWATEGKLQQGGHLQEKKGCCSKRKSSILQEKQWHDASQEKKQGASKNNHLQKEEVSLRKRKSLR